LDLDFCAQDDIFCPVVGFQTMILLGFNYHSIPSKLSQLTVVVILHLSPSPAHPPPPLVLPRHIKKRGGKRMKLKTRRRCAGGGCSSGKLD
jgi:hypothetical protein